MKTKKNKMLASKKVRSWMVLEMLGRKSGAHGQSEKAKRRDDKMQLRKDLKDGASVSQYKAGFPSLSLPWLTKSL